MLRVTNRQQLIVRESMTLIGAIVFSRIVKSAVRRFAEIIIAESSTVERFLKTGKELSVFSKLK